MALRQTFRPVAVSVDVEYTDGALVAHTLLRYAHNLVIGIIESHAFYRCGEFPLVQAFSCLDGPQSKSVVSRTRYEKPGLCWCGRLSCSWGQIEHRWTDGRTVDIDRPDSSVVTVVSSEALAVV